MPSGWRAIPEMEAYRRMLRVYLGSFYIQLQDNRLRDTVPSHSLEEISRRERIEFVLETRERERSGLDRDGKWWTARYGIIVVTIYGN